MKWGNKDGVFEISDVDAFYEAHGLKTIATGPDDAKAMYYGDAQTGGIIAGAGYHGAKKTSCSCGGGQWIMFESKCGPWERIEHVWDQVNGSTYSTPTRFYK